MYTCIRKCACLFPNWYQLDPDYLGISVLRIGDENQPKSDFAREASNFKNSFPPNPYGGKSTMADSIPRSIFRNSRFPDPPEGPTRVKIDQKCKNHEIAFQTLDLIDLDVTKPSPQVSRSRSAKTGVFLRSEFSAKMYMYGAYIMALYESPQEGGACPGVAGRRHWPLGL